LQKHIVLCEILSCQCLDTTQSTEIRADGFEFLLFCHIFIAYNLVQHYTLNFSLVKPGLCKSNTMDSSKWKGH